MVRPAPQDAVLLRRMTISALHGSFHQAHCSIDRPLRPSATFLPLHYHVGTDYTDLVYGPTSVNNDTSPRFLDDAHVLPTVNDVAASSSNDITTLMSPPVYDVATWTSSTCILAFIPEAPPSLRPSTSFQVPWASSHTPLSPRSTPFRVRRPNKSMRQHSCLGFPRTASPRWIVPTLTLYSRHGPTRMSLRHMSSAEP